MSDKTIEMPAAILSKWLAALRSGRYKQVSNAMAANGGYCCLGVLQMECGGVIVESEDGSLPDPDWLEEKGITFRGAVDVNTPYLPTLRMSADRANDTGKTFAEIADAIEATAEATQ